MGKSQVTDGIPQKHLDLHVGQIGSFLERKGYRIVERSTPMPGVEMSERAKRLSVIIMDTDFRILGESEIAEDIHACFRYTCFVSEEGLNIQLLDPDTDRMTFATYATTVKHHRQ